MEISEFKSGGGQKRKNERGRFFCEMGGWMAFSSALEVRVAQDHLGLECNLNR